MTQETETQLINVLTRIAEALEKGVRPSYSSASTKPAQQGGATIVPQTGIEDVTIRIESVTPFKKGGGNFFHGKAKEGDKEIPACLCVHTDKCSTEFIEGDTVRCWATRKNKLNYLNETDFWFSEMIEYTPAQVLESQKPEQTVAIKHTSDIDQDVPF